MASTIKWSGGFTSRSTVLTTELNSLGAGSRTNAGTEINNATNLDEFGYFELAVTFGSAPAAGGYVSIYALMAADGTNYVDGSSSVDPGAATWVCDIPIRNTTNAQRVPSQVCRLFPAKTKFIAANNTSVAFPSSGSTVTLFTTNEAVG